MIETTKVDGLEKTNNSQIALQWQKRYLYDLIDALQPFGEVLEVGFGSGYSADHVQSFHPKQHTIIEADPITAKQALQWSSQYSNVRIIEDTWQNALPHLKTFDAIFFNDSSFEEIKMHHRETGHLALLRGQEILSIVEEKIPQLKSIRYSDQDFDAFYQQMGKQHPKETSRFLCELKSNQQISAEQYETLAQKYNLKLDSITHSTSLLEKQEETVFAFLQACLKNHMHNKSRFSCFSHTPTSKYENPLFFEHIITNPDLDYQEQLIPISIRESDENYAQDALIIVIEKVN